MGDAGGLAFRELPARIAQEAPHEAFEAGEVARRVPLVETKRGVAVVRAHRVPQLETRVGASNVGADD